MKIVPIEINFKSLYENRHLYTDDSHYNSLVISNAINTKVNLINVDYYNTLDDDSKYHIYEYYNKKCNCIFNKNGLYVLGFDEIRLCFDIVHFSWKYYYLSCDIDIDVLLFDILTIVE